MDYVYYEFLYKLLHVYDLYLIGIIDSVVTYWCPRSSMTTPQLAEPLPRLVVQDFVNQYHTWQKCDFDQRS